MICGFIALVLLIISLVADSWVYSNDIRQSLWKSCTSSNTGNSPDCVPIIDCKYASMPMKSIFELKRAKEENLLFLSVVIH